jgi:hypothetical protein
MVIPFTMPRTPELDALLSRLGIERVDFLKMNIEGAELKALEGFRHGLARTLNLAVACHDGRAERRLRRIPHEGAGANATPVLRIRRRGRPQRRSTVAHRLPVRESPGSAAREADERSPERLSRRTPRHARLAHANERPPAHELAPLPPFVLQTGTDTEDERPAAGLGARREHARCDTRARDD